MPIDRFKDLKEVFEPDLKNNISFEEYYSKIAEIILKDSVPNEIKDHFDVAKNLMLYSWFVRRFKHVAELHAFSSVEFAIRTKIKIELPEKIQIRNLKPLLQLAIKQKWIVDDGFPEIVYKKKQRKQSQRKYEEEFGIKVTLKEEVDNQKLTKDLVNLLPSLRNIFAHGSNDLYSSYLELLNACGHIINQLFSK